MWKKSDPNKEFNDKAKAQMKEDIKRFNEFKQQIKKEEKDQKEKLKRTGKDIKIMPLEKELSRRKAQEEEVSKCQEKACKEAWEQQEKKYKEQKKEEKKKIYQKFF